VIDLEILAVAMGALYLLAVGCFLSAFVAFFSRKPKTYRSVVEPTRGDGLPSLSELPPGSLRLEPVRAPDILFYVQLAEQNRKEGITWD
jgi:hypothetical protein